MIFSSDNCHKFVLIYTFIYFCGYYLSLSSYAASSFVGFFTILIVYDEYYFFNALIGNHFLHKNIGVISLF